MEVIQGRLSRIYQKSVRDFLIAAIDPGGRKVVGVLPNPVIGDKLEFHGRWEEHELYGRQFRFDLAVKVIPKTTQDMLEFLSQLQHIGPVRAKAIIKIFGDRIFDILDQDPQKLCVISGITPDRVSVLVRGWQRIKEDKENIFFLNGLGCSQNQRKAIIDCYQDKTIELIQENPYRMVKEIRGFGFKTVDGFAMKMGIKSDSPLRAEAAVEHILKSAAESKQHTYLPEDELLSIGVSEFKLSHRRQAEAMTALAEKEIIVRNTGERWCALSSFHNYERSIAEKLRMLQESDSALFSRAKILDTFNDPVTGQTIVLNDKQLEAVRLACENNVVIITGLPGTGKTTLLKAILQIFQERTIRQASPTGKAAKRMEEATGLHACTVHRLLGYDPKEERFLCCEENPLDTGLVIIDESSMMDSWLTDCLLKALAPGTKLILVGDADQLPSVGPGNVLSDLLASNVIPSIKLTQIMRQAEASTIIKNAHRINRGLPIDIYGKKDFFFIEEDDADLIVKRIRKLVTEDIPQKFNLDPVNDIQVLCPQNVGAIGSVLFNNRLQRSLNPARDTKPEVKIGTEESSYYLRLGDRVIQTVNNYTLGVFNGAAGVIIAIDRESRQVWVDFTNGSKHSNSIDKNGIRSDMNNPEGNLNAVKYDHDQLSQLKLAYAISIHKSQGSEFPCVVIPIHQINKTMLMRNLLYTAITRGKKYVFVVGSEPALDYAIDNNVPTQRYTHLARFLKEQF